jgi:DNA-binding transcriptional regulator GbsR (MarR family)
MYDSGMKIIEKKYRGSVVCRVLGYPITYAIVKELLERGPMELDDIVKIVRRAKNTVCTHLSKLKMANIVRFDKKQKRTVYWIKYPPDVSGFFDACEKLVKRTTERIDRDD